LARRVKRPGATQGLVILFRCNLPRCVLLETPAVT
jgi:hypothetical protein